MNTFVFDIETVPDVNAGRRLYDLENLSDEDVAEAMFALQEERNGSRFLRHHLQRIVAISVALRTRDSFKVWTLGDPDASEKEILERFFSGIERFTPTMVSWNGGGFDLPVIHYRSLLQKISAPRYFETGDSDQSFKWNNYLSRFHSRHTDLMDVIAGYQNRANAPLDEIASMLGFPGKMGMSGAKVWDEFKAGNIAAIRDYCETDVLNTHLVYLRFELLRGNLTEDRYQQEETLVADFLKQADKAHLSEFLAAWDGLTV